MFLQRQYPWRHVSRFGWARLYKEMLRREALVALRSYTRLPRSVQGLLERRGTEYELAGGIARGDSFERALQQVDVDVFCVSKLHIMRSSTDESPRAVAGSFVLRGKAVKLDDGMFAVVSVITGNVPAELRRPENVYLLRLFDADFVRCSVPQQLPWGTNCNADALAPRWNYISALFSKRVQHAVVSCPNGLFCMRSAAHASELTTGAAEKLLTNLLDLDVVLEAPGRGSPPAARTLYRLAANALFVAPEGSEAELEQLQRTLKLPSYPGVVATLPTSIANFSLHSSLLQTSGPSVDLEAVRSAAPRGSTVTRQSLSRWWSAPVNFDIELTATLAADQATLGSLALALREGPRKDFDVALQLRFSALRTPRPGESEATLKAQLGTVLGAAVAGALLDFQPSGLTQGGLDKLTRDLGDAAEVGLNGAQLFDGSVTVAVQLAFNHVEGETVDLPSGEVVVIPRFATDLSSPRLNAYLGVFATLGLQGSFTGWQQAMRNRVAVI